MERAVCRLALRKDRLRSQQETGRGVDLAMQVREMLRAGGCCCCGKSVDVTALRPASGSSDQAATARPRPRPRPRRRARHTPCSENAGPVAMWRGGSRLV